MIYITEVKSDQEDKKSYQFQLKLVFTGGEYLLSVDWMNLTELEEIQLKPDVSKSHQPIKLNKNDILIEITASDF